MPIAARRRPAQPRQRDADRGAGAGAGGARARRGAGRRRGGGAGSCSTRPRGVFLALVAVVGLASAAVSPAYLRHAGRSWFGARRSHVWYYAAFNLFWAALLALPLADNLAVAWLLVEATTAASALLVAFSGKRSALEAGWKYVVLTTLGLAIALLGIVVLFAAGGGEPGVDTPRLARARRARRRAAAGRRRWSPSS